MIQVIFAMMLGAWLMYLYLAPVDEHWFKQSRPRRGETDKQLGRRVRKMWKER